MKKTFFVNVRHFYTKQNRTKVMSGNVVGCYGILSSSTTSDSCISTLKRPLTILRAECM